MKQSDQIFDITDISKALVGLGNVDDKSSVTLLAEALDAVNPKLDLKLDSDATAANSNALEGFDSLYFRTNQGANNQDPDLIFTPYALSIHTNAPDPDKYWHIHTQCYGEPTSTCNRAQIAIEYNPDDVARTYSRACNSGVFTEWSRCDTNAIDVLDKIKTVDGIGSGLDAELWQGATQFTSTAAASGGSDGDIWFQY